MVHRLLYPQSSTGFVRLTVSLVVCTILIPLALWAESAEPPLSASRILTAGTTELGIAGGFWQAVDFVNHPPSTDRSAVFVLPKVGMIVTDRLGAGLLSGNLEVGIEPLYAHFTTPFAAEAAGATAMVTYNLLSFGRWAPFWEAGAGGLWTDLAPRIPEQSSRLNFVLQTGPGIRVFITESLSVTAGIRYHHVSNADIGQRNTGLNAALPYLGMSWFFPR